MAGPGGAELSNTLFTITPRRRYQSGRRPTGDLNRIFGRFARATPYRNREAGGFGLGLPIVQAIAEAHHGSVRVDSTV